MDRAPYMDVIWVCPGPSHTFLGALAILPSLKHIIWLFQNHHPSQQRLCPQEKSEP